MSENTHQSFLHVIFLNIKIHKADQSFFFLVPFSYNSVDVHQYLQPSLIRATGKFFFIFCDVGVFVM